MNSFKNFSDLLSEIYFKTDLDKNREQIYGRAYVLKLAEIRQMDRKEIRLYLNKYRNWYFDLKMINVHSWTNTEISYVSLYDYALNKKRSYD
jgi:hypothetical protein